MTTLRTADLFCGAGGLSLGLRQAGLSPVFAADRDAHSCATYAENLGDHVRRLDLGAMTGAEIATLVRSIAGEVDVVAGGPPCQGFSIQRRGTALDARNDLVLKFSEAALALRPRAILMENVPTILGPRGRDHLGRLESDWEAEGYDVHRTILDAAAYGVPQRRRRAFVIGIRGDIAAPSPFPRPRLARSEYVTVREALHDLPDPPADYADHPRFPNHRRVAISPINLVRLRHVPEGGGRLDIPAELQLPCHRDANGHRHLDVFGRLWWDRPAGTITAMFDNFTRGRFAHPSQDRNITGREGARLQSFPDDFTFVGPKKDVARQIGNAVPPLLARAVGEALADALESRGRAPEKLVQGVLAL